MKQFDKEIRNKINSFDSPVSPDLWSKLESRRAIDELEKGISKKSPKIWTILIMALLVTSGGILWVNQNNLDASKNKAPIHENLQNQMDDKMIIHKDIADNSLSNQSETNHSKNIFNENTKPNSIKNTIPKTINSKKHFLHQKTTYSKKTNHQGFNNASSSHKNILYNKNLTLDFSGNQVGGIDKISLKNATNRVTSNAVKKNKIQNFSSVLPAWPHFNSTNKKLKLSKSSELACGIRPQNYPFTYYLDFGFSPDRTVKYFKLKDDQYNGYAQARENTEGFHFAYAMNVRLSMVHYTGITFKTGLSFQQTNDFFEYIDPNYTEETNEGVVTGPYEIAKYNRYKSFDIPLMVGYELDANSFTFSLNTGIHMNLFFDKSGYFLTPSESWSTFKNDNKVYKNWIGASWATNIGAYFHITNRTQLMMEPHFNYSLTSLTVKDYPIAQRNFTTGMRLGLRFRL